MTRLGRSLGRALRTIEDYEVAAAEHPAVKRVVVRAAANDPRVPRGHVEVIVQGRWRSRLPDHVVREVRDRIAAENPVGVVLRVWTQWA